MSAKWDPADENVVEVIRGPQPSGPGGAYRAFGETLRGLKTTFRRGVVGGVTTFQYPEEKVPVYPRFRGRHRLHRFEDTGLARRSMLGMAMLCVAYRLVMGPRAQDRVLALDTLYVNAMLMLLTFGIQTGRTLYFEATLIIALLGGFSGIGGGPFYGTGYYGGGGLGLVIVILLILLLLGKL